VIAPIRTPKSFIEPSPRPLQFPQTENRPKAQVNPNAIGCGRNERLYTRDLSVLFGALMADATPAGAPVAIIMGSRSDWPTLKAAAEVLDALGVAYEAKVVSAHRTPDRMYAFAKGAKAAGFKVIIAGAGGAAHLPGMTASMTELPVLGVPVESRALKGLDSLLSINQMPAGIAVATLAIGEAGAANAGLLAAQILALSDAALAQRVTAHRAAMRAAVAETVAD
jgi:5-(carboxyamino)imidazole ribonucleotide mutase